MAYYTSLVRVCQPLRFKAYGSSLLPTVAGEEEVPYIPCLQQARDLPLLTQESLGARQENADQQ